MKRIACLLVLLATLPACDRDDRPNVLLITLDTTRADRLGCYGYEPARTPHLDGLAARGVRFQRATCQVPLTLPSHASILTSLFPPSHGLRINGVVPLPEDLPVLPALLQEQGYRTSAFIAAWVLKRSWGLGRGFEFYEDYGWSNLDDDSPRERPAGEVCDGALQWLGQEDGRPFFTWVHLYDPHVPYEPPEGYRVEGGDPYDGEIAYMDAQIGRLLAWLDEEGLREQTLVVVAGDHGEAFEEHGEIEHGLFVYDVTMQVPFIISWPGGLPVGRVVEPAVRLVDLAPTILDLLERPVPESWQGRPLRGLMEGRAEPERPEYGESEYPDLTYGWAGLRSFASGGWKLVDAPDPELYDLRSDPSESINRLDQHPEKVARLRSELAEFLTAHPVRELESTPLSPEDRAALESLGYLTGPASTGPAAEEEAGRDPKRMLPVYRGIIQAKKLDRQQKHQELIELLEPLLLQDPESVQLFSLLGSAYRSLERWEEADGIYRRALQTRTDEPGMLYALGETLREMGRPEDALGAFRQILVIDPEHAAAHAGIGSLLAGQGRLQEALASFQRGLEAHPRSATALANVGVTLHSLKRSQVAMEYLERALKIDPGHRPAHQNLWQTRFALGDRVGAVKALQAALEFWPGDAEMDRRLIGLLATTPELGEAGRREAIQRAQALKADDPENLEMLALAFAASGEFPRAVDTAKEAIRLSLDQGRGEMATRLSASYRAYRARRLH